MCLISSTCTVQETHLFKPHHYFSSTFNFDNPVEYKRINFLTNVNDHLISSRFFPSLLDRQLTSSCPDSNTLLDNKQQQQMEFLRWISYSSMARTESSNVLIDVFLFREMILYLPLYLKCN